MSVPPSLHAASVDASPASPRIFEITGELSINTVAEWHRRLTEELDASAPLAVELSGVERADVFGVQLLVACRQAAARRGQTVEFLHAPPVLQSAATAAGIDGQRFTSR